MSHNSLKKNYEIQDFLDYHSGNMSEADMHALEKAALADPFLSDALQGFKGQNNAESGLTLLQQRLEKRVTQKTRPLFNNNIKLLYTSLSVAASLLIIITGAYLVLHENQSPTKNNPVVAQHNGAPIVADNTTSPTPVDTQNNPTEVIVTPKKTASSTSLSSTSNLAVKQKLNEHKFKNSIQRSIIK